MSKTLRTCLVLGLATGISLPASARQFASPEGKAQPQITLIVYDCMGLKSRVLTAALEGVTRILANARVNAIPIVCRNTSSDPASAHCRQDPSPVAIRIRIVANPTRFIAGTDGETMGYTAGDLVTIYFSRVNELAIRADLDSDEVLGCVIAHELGHVLLGPNHTPTGIMSVSWGEDVEAKLIRQRALGFLPFQQERMRAEVLSRERQAASQQAGSVAVAAK
jgi:hypothetical protein